MPKSPVGTSGLKGPGGQSPIARFIQQELGVCYLYIFPDHPWLTWISISQLAMVKNQRLAEKLVQGNIYDCVCRFEPAVWLVSSLNINQRWRWQHSSGPPIYDISRISVHGILYVNLFSFFRLSCKRAKKLPVSVYFYR